MPPIVPHNTGVAATQQGFLLQALAAPESGIGILQIVLEFVDELFEPHLFLDALQQIVASHALLRKKFVRHQSGFAEIIEAKVAVPAAVMDWQDKTATEVETAKADFLTVDRYRGFDPSIAPLLRCTCIRLPGQRSLAVLTHHHLILDGVARDAILSELIGLYDHARYGHPLAPTRRIPDAVLPETTAPVDSETKAYWQMALAELGKESPLATLRATGQPDPSRQSHIQIDLPLETTKTLRAVGVKLGVPLSTLVYAAWALCLNRISQEQDIAFLTIRNARSGGGGAEARSIGSFVNSVPLRLRVDRSTTVGAFAAAAHSTWKSALPHAFTSLSEIKSWCDAGDRTWDNNILYDHDRFEATLNRSAPAGSRRLVRIMEHSDLPLTVAVLRRHSLAIHIQFWTNAFRRGVVEEVAASFAAILTGIAANPDSRICDLPYLSEAQRLRLDEAACGPVDLDAAELLLHDDFEKFAALHPECLALEWEGGRLTYGALDEAANALAAELRADGIATEEPVAVLIERSAAHLIALFAVLKSGAAYLPLDPSHPDPFLKQVLASAGARRCLTSSALAQRAHQLAATVLPISAARLQARASRPLPETPSAIVRPNHLAYLIATSGTTGEPKIVEIEHRAAANTLRHSVDKLYAPGDLALIPWTDSPANDAGVHQIFGPLACGGTLVPIDSLERLKFSPRFSDFTAFGSTPSMLESLIAGSALAPRLRTVVFGGEVYPESLPSRLAASSEIRRAVNVYGPTEAAIYCVADDILAEGGGVPQGDIIGRPITNTRIDLLDSDLQPVIPGTLGEICISGVNLARGYHDDLEKTERSFPQAICADGKRRRIYRSGDLGAILPDGRLEFHGRMDRQVKVHGVRVELGSIERIIESLPGVDRALLAFRPDSHGKNQLLAWVVAQKGIVLDPAVIRNCSRQHLPSAMVPRSVMVIDQIPLNLAGKPDLAALPLPLDEAIVVESFKTLDEREALIAAEWRKLLGHDSFGNDDDFFEAGGDSLSGMELLLRLGELFGCGLSNASLNGRWTIAAIAQASRTAPPIDSFKLIGANREGASIFWFMTNFVDFDVFNSIEVPRPVHLIGTDRIETARETLDQFAERIVERIRLIQPLGPYLLGGYCFGGYAAFEVATRLKTAGAHVEKLGLVDRSGPSAPYRLLVRAQDFRNRYLPHSLPDMLPRRKKILRRSFPQGTPVHAPGTEWREPLARKFRPSGEFCSPVLVMETSHGRRPLSGLIPYSGWRKWVRGELHVDRQRTVAPEVGIRRVLLYLAGESERG